MNATTFISNVPSLSNAPFPDLYPYLWILKRVDESKWAGLEKLTHLEVVLLENNPDLTLAKINELKKALPNCKIEHNAKK